MPKSEFEHVDLQPGEIVSRKLLPHFAHHNVMAVASAGGKQCYVGGVAETEESKNKELHSHLEIAV